MSNFSMTLRKKHGRAGDSIPDLFSVNDEDHGDDGRAAALAGDLVATAGSKSSKGTISETADKKQAGRAKSKEPSRKRRKTIGFDSDVLGIIMEFVGGPRELYAMAFSCKTLLEKLTMSMVIKCAYVSGEKTAIDAIRGITDCLEISAIHVPSPARLLRLTNAKCCEICSQKSDNICRENMFGFGLFCCAGCQGGLVVQEETFVGLDPVSRFIDLYGDHETTHDASTRTCDVHVKIYQKVCADGEIAGPVETLEHLKKIRVLLDELPQRLATAIVDDVLQYYPETTDCYKEFMAACEVGKRLKMDADTIRSEQRKEKALKAAQNKMRNLDMSLTNLKRLLSEHIQHFILNYDADANFAVTFCCPFVDELLRGLGYLRAPTKVRSQELEEAATTLNNKIQILVDADFLSANYLSSTHRFERQLKPIFLERFPDLASAAPRLTARVFDLVKQDRLLQAMYELARFPFSSSKFGERLLFNVSISAKLDDRIDSSKLKGAIWEVCYSASKAKPRADYKKARAAYKKARAKMRQMVAMVMAFLHWAKAKDSTDAFMTACIKVLYTSAGLRNIRGGDFDFARRAALH